MSNRIKNTGLIALCCSCLFFMTLPAAQAQRSFIRSKIRDKIERDMEKKYLDPQRERGTKALEEITYENDSRYPIPENPVKATFTIQTTSFKKNGKVQRITTSKLVFGSTGECIIMNEGKKEETRMLFDYETAANYLVNVADKTAMKMPMINFKKMAERMQQNHPEPAADRGTWERTNETKTINGYTCQKYRYTEEEGNRMIVWVTQEVTIDLSENHLLGSQIQSFADLAPEKPNKNAPSGLMIRNIYYEQGASTPSLQMDVLQVKKSANPKYFDLSDYEVTDIFGG